VLELHQAENDAEVAVPATDARLASWAHKDLLDTDTLSLDEITRVLDHAEAMREVRSRPVGKVATLRGRTVVTLFYEQSTRTRASFEVAAKFLGADVVNLTASGSSVEKGETLIDTVKTLEAIGADVVVIRSGRSGAPYLAARHTSAHVINGGDGTHAHPTQALLDLFTLRRLLGSLEGRRIVIAGDILHSRVARSNLWTLSVSGASVVLCGPPTLLPRTLADLAAAGRCEVTTDLDAALAGADAVMMLRMQKERQVAGLVPSLREYIRGYQLNARRLALARPGAPVLHPGPMNEGIEIAPDVAHGLNSAIDEQVANGVAVRMAVLYLLCVGASR